MKKGLVPVLFESKADCCGCGACRNACPVGAISMAEDDCGFLYPCIDEEKCIRCGKCKSVCAFQKGTAPNSPRKTFAAQRKDTGALLRSSSGGVFAAMAEQVLASGGVVYGAAFEDAGTVAHISAETPQQLQRILGSKYTHSDTRETFRRVEEDLKQGRQVLYGGTPCQIAGLYGYLGGDRQGLLTADLVCHGVPSNRMLREYLELLEKRSGGTLTEFVFRDKTVGWGINGSAKFLKNGRTEKKRIWQSGSSYLYYFTQGWLYRSSCYRCPYACAKRPANVTLGDYWGIEKMHPEYLGKQGFDERLGISVVIANTEKGEQAVSALDGLVVLPSDFEKASAGNHQLQRPSAPGKREELLALYRQSGWEGLDARFNRSIGWRRHTSRIKSLLPPGVKRWLKQHR